MITTAEDILKRSAGETIYGGVSPQQRAAEQMGMDLAELESMITRRESGCAQLLFTGSVDVVGDGYDETIQYWSANPAEQPYVALGAGDRWNEGTGNPLLDFRAQRRLAIQNSGVNPIDAILGTDALEAMLGNANFKSQLDSRRIDMGMIDPQNLPNGVTYWGYLKDSGLDIWSYDEWYLDDNGVEQPMVPTKNVLIGSPNARTTMAYGCG